MTDPDRWLGANDQYLATMLEWLRGRLEHLAGPDVSAAIVTKDVSQPAQPPAKTAGKPRSLRDRIFRSDVRSMPPLARENVWTASSTAGGTLPEPAPQIDEEAAERPPALIALAQRLGLSEFEQHTLLLCAAMELDTRMGALCARAQRDPGRNFPTFALVLTLFDQPAWDVLSPERPLRFWRLIEINQPGAQPLITSALKADERIVNYIKGLNYLDDRLAPLVMPLARSDAPLPPSQQGVADVIVRHLERLQGGDACRFSSCWAATARASSSSLKALSHGSASRSTGCPRKRCRPRPPSTRHSCVSGSAKARCCRSRSTSTPGRWSAAATRTHRRFTGCSAGTLASCSSTRANRGRSSAGTAFVWMSPSRRRPNSKPCGPRCSARRRAASRRGSPASST